MPEPGTHQRVLALPPRDWGLPPMIPALVEIVVREIKRGNREALRLVVRDLLRRRAGPSRETGVHLDAVMQWICRAQDATATGGVSRSYCVAWHPYFRTVGWLPPYPETTGYIIPTMFDYAAATGSADIRRRAIAMAEWEMAVQMPSGAVQGGVIGMTPTPAVFNTGQVIFGWVRAAQETGDERYLRAAERAGNFLVEHQDGDGVWRRGSSRHAKAGPQTYNTRTAWALLELATTTRDRKFRDAGVRNIESALQRQLENGWFSGNCLDNEDAPLTHTIGYAMEGLLEAGRLLGEERYVAAAQRTADALHERQRPDGSLAGRYDRHWRPAVRWSCLTGNAQTALVWLRLSQLLQQPAYVHAAVCGLAFLGSVQDLQARSEGVRGGIAGAYPILGDYGRLEYLSWAAKFFADALMCLDQCHDDSSAQEPTPAQGHGSSRAQAAMEREEKLTWMDRVRHCLAAGQS